MSNTKRVGSYEITRREYDGVYIVYALKPWPDDVLDNNPEALKRWLTGTKGWRAHGWVPVYVTESGRKANRWAWKQVNGNTLEEENEDDFSV